MVKYVVLKEGKRGYTLVSIHPKGRLSEARASAIYTANKDKAGVMVCQVLERSIVIVGHEEARELLDQIPTVEFETVKEVLAKAKK